MENQQLRTLLKELGRFIGDGAGGQLSTSLGTIGWGLDQFTGFINRSETDTAFETFQALKRSKDPAKDQDGGEGAGEGSDNRKRRRTTDSGPPSSNGIGGPFGLGGPVAASPTSGPSPNAAAAFASLMDSQVFGAPTTGSNFPSRHNSMNMSGDASTSVGASSSNTLPMASPSGLYPTSFAQPPSSFLGQGPRSASGSNLPPMPPSNTTTKSNSAAKEIATLFAGEWSGIDDPDVLKKTESGMSLFHRLRFIGLLRPRPDPPLSSRPFF